MEESLAPEYLLLDITGLAHLFGGEVLLAETILRGFTQWGLAVRLGIADTVGAASAVARYCGGREMVGDEVLRRGDFAIVAPGETAAALRFLPIEALRLSDRVVELLHQLGVGRIDQLELLPRDELSSRFGPELLRRWDQALGRLAEPVPSHEPPPQLQADWSPQQPTARRATVEAALEQLIDRVAAMLGPLGVGAVRLECRLDCQLDCQLDSTGNATEAAEPVGFSVGVFEPTASPKHLFELAQMQLQRLRLPGPVLAMHVAVTATAELECRQQEMFFRAGEGKDGLRQDARRLTGLIDRLSSRLGRRSVLRVRLVPDAQPELAYRYRPLIEGTRRRHSPRGRAPRGRSAKQRPVALPPRPLRLLPRPVALAAMSTIPDGPPLRFCFRDREHRIAHTWGPERIETGWWRGHVVGRDYYRIESIKGQRFWLFRRLRDGRWFMHGMLE